MKILREIMLLFALTLGMAGCAAAQTNAGDLESAGSAKEALSAKPVAKEELPAVPIPQFPADQKKLDNWKQVIAGVQSALSIRSISESALNEMRNQIGDVQSGAQKLISESVAPTESAVARAAQLEPDPNSSNAQSEDIKLERAKLQAEISARQAIIQQAKLVNLTSQQTLEAISGKRRGMFNDLLLRRSAALINPAFWISAAGQVPAAFARLTDLLVGWSGNLASQPMRTASGFAMAAIVLLVFALPPMRRWQARWIIRDPDVKNVRPLRKTGSAAAIVLIGFAMPSLALLALYHSLVALGLLPEGISEIVRSLFVGIAFGFFLVSLTTATVAPERPEWRLIEISEVAAQRLIPIVVMIGLVIALSLTIDATLRAIDVSLDLSIANQGITALLKALLIMAALRRVADSEGNESALAPSAASATWRLIIPVGWLAAIAAIIGPLSGYVTFGRFVANEIIIAVTLLMSLVLLSQFASAAIDSGFSLHGFVGRSMRQAASFSHSAIRQIAAIISGLTQVALFALAALAFLASWGVQSEDLIGSITSAFFGFQVGSFTISVSDIVTAIALLLVGILATRSLQGWLGNSFLPETSLDVGIRDSIRTGMGYAGVILATVLALSSLGLNLQNIAIVAGALSVGIGFGLQSIINNFVSGLILLVERPVKVGDRIEVGTRMGVVKRINVRATEIVTYDNLSVIVPNSELISGQVVNWMHSSFSARLSLQVGTSYSSDPDRVIAILLDVAACHERTLKTPAPFAILSGFGADSLDFTLFFHVGNIGTDAGVANDVRLEILKRFRQEGIEIPFVQRDLHLRDLERLEGILKGMVRLRGDKSD